MKTKLPYPLLVPPDDLGETTPPYWSRSQANAYAEWLRSRVPVRTREMVRYFGMDEEAPATSLLQPLGELVADALAHVPFSENGRLTNQGHALAADMGLLLASALLDEHPDLVWSVVRKPKSDVSYNQPVLIGFGVVPFDPLQISTTQAFAVLRGTKDGGAWRQVFKYWSGQHL